MELSQEAKWKEASDKGMDGLEKHEVVDLASSCSMLSEKKFIETKWTFKVKVEHALKAVSYTHLTLPTKA